MELKLSEAQRLLFGLNSLEKEDHKFSDEVRLSVAININRLMPLVKAYETVMVRREHEIMGETFNPMKQAALSVAMSELGDKVETVELRTFNLASLNMKENTKLKGSVVAMVAPIISDFDE